MNWNKNWRYHETLFFCIFESKQNIQLPSWRATVVECVSTTHKKLDSHSLASLTQNSLFASDIFLLLRRCESTNQIWQTKPDQTEQMWYKIETLGNFLLMGKNHKLNLQLKCNIHFVRMSMSLSSFIFLFFAFPMNEWCVIFSFLRLRPYLNANDAARKKKRSKRLEGKLFVGVVVKHAVVAVEDDNDKTLTATGCCLFFVCHHCFCCVPCHHYSHRASGSMM